MAGADEALGILREINHGEKVGRQFPAALFNGEVFLVAAHHGDEDLVGKFEEGGIKGAFDDVRELVEIAHELQQFGIRMNVKTGAFDVAGEFALDSFATLGGAHDDSVCTKFLFVIGKVLDADLRLAQEAVAYSSVARGETAEGEFQGLAVEDADEPTNGPDEAGAFQAGPGHGAWPRDIVNHAGENFEE